MLWDGESGMGVVCARRLACIEACTEAASLLSVERGTDIWEERKPCSAAEAATHIIQKLHSSKRCWFSSFHVQERIVSALRK